jgi:SpoVK/Ycf46/Vps4 family AAA+-type ATPase
MSVSADLFETVLTFPDSEMQARYAALCGLDDVKAHLAKEAETLLRPDLLEKWCKEKHGAHLPAIDLLRRRPPLIIFAGDVGTGKTELATTFADPLSREMNLDVELFNLSLRARGSGAVGEMTKLISDAFLQLRAACPKHAPAGKKPSGAAVLLIDEADALAQSREMVQMHHEDRAGVNALIRGIDDLANARLPVLVIMCTNRLSALDPAVRRRAAAVFEFKRPSLPLRKKLLTEQLAGAGLSQAAINELGESLGETKQRDYGFTFSDITQRLIPAIVLAAYPDHKITGEVALRVAASIQPTPPFKAG